MNIYHCYILYPNHFIEKCFFIRHTQVSNQSKYFNYLFTVGLFFERNQEL